LGPGVRFINFNITRFDAAKNSGLPLVADVRRILADLTGVIAGWSVGPCCRDESGGWPSKGTPPVEQPTRRVTSPAGPSEVIGVVNALRGPRDVVVCASGSMPGDLHKQSRTRHVLLPPITRRDIRGNAVQFPRHGPDVVPPGRHRLRQPFINSRPPTQAARARKTSVPRLSPHPSGSFAKTYKSVLSEEYRANVRRNNKKRNLNL
jgi:hypothetical protein